MSVEVLNPNRRGAVLAVHDGLTAEEANELVRIYRALGYPDASISVAPQQQQEAA